MRTPLDPGPYCDEDGDWWVPVAAIPNRMKAAHEVRMCVDSDSKVRYEGLQRGVRLEMEHDDVCEPDEETGEEPPCIALVDCWHFTEDWAWA
jgi:hypothetical protein